jgi:hypothetical protein
MVISLQYKRIDKYCCKITSNDEVHRDKSLLWKNISQCQAGLLDTVQGCTQYRLAAAACLSRAVALELVAGLSELCRGPTTGKDPDSYDLPLRPPCDACGQEGVVLQLEESPRLFSAKTRLATGPRRESVVPGGGWYLRAAGLDAPGMSSGAHHRQHWMTRRP